MEARGEDAFRDWLFDGKFDDLFLDEDGGRGLYLYAGPVKAGCGTRDGYSFVMPQDFEASVGVRDNLDLLPAVRLSTISLFTEHDGCGVYVHRYKRG